MDPRICFYIYIRGPKTGGVDGNEKIAIVAAQRQIDSS